MPELPIPVGSVVAVCLNSGHAFSKRPAEAIRLVAGFGVQGDAHQGVTVQHRSRVAADPTQPNLRQVHLIHSELFAELRDAGFRAAPGLLGENITTSGLDLLQLPRGTVLRLGKTVVVTVTGLRNPCAQLDQFQAGLLKALVSVDESGRLIRKAGIMSVVTEGGEVCPGDPVVAEFPLPPYEALERV